MVREQYKQNDNDEKTGNNICTVSSIQSHSHLQDLILSWLVFSRSVASDCRRPWTAAHEASLSFTISQSWLRLMDWSIPVLTFWSCYLICDANSESGEKTYLVCLKNTLAPSSLRMGHSFLKLFLAPLHLLACNTCHYRKSVSYTVIPKHVGPACGECGVWGKGGWGKSEEASLPEGCLTEHWANPQSGCPHPKGTGVRNLNPYPDFIFHSHVADGSFFFFFLIRAFE